MNSEAPSLISNIKGMIVFISTDPLFLLTVLAMAAVILKSKYWKSSNSVPSMLTSIGVLGTFLGIVFGLWNFDSTNINASVPMLIEGLKTSFFTSIAGIIASTVLKFYPNIYLKESESEEYEDSTIDTLAQLLKETKEQQNEHNQKFFDYIKVENQNKRDTDTEIHKQLTLLRADQGNHSEKLIKEFQEFAKHMTENNAKAFIEALQEVIKDFNNNLTEQFGENFKELNSAVEKLVLWQEQHKSHVQLIDTEFNEIKVSIKEIEQSFSIIAKDADQFKEISKEIKTQNSELSLITGELAEGLGGIRDLGKEAKSTFPIIKTNIEELTTEYSRLIKKTIESSVNEYEVHQKVVSEQINRVHQNFDQLGKKIDKQMDENADRIAKQVEVLDKQLEDELNKALQSLGTQLGSLSNKFVKDYSQLADVLENVVKATTKTA